MEDQKKSKKRTFEDLYLENLGVTRPTSRKLNKNAAWRSSEAFKRKGPRDMRRAFWIRDGG